MLTRCAYSVYLSKTKHAFVPPKPKELDITRLTWVVRVRVRVRVGVRFGVGVGGGGGLGLESGLGLTSPSWRLVRMFMPSASSTWWG